MNDGEFYQMDGNSKKELNENAINEHHFYGLNCDLPSFPPNLYVEVLTLQFDCIWRQALPKQVSTTMI